MIEEDFEGAVGKVFKNVIHDDEVAQELSNALANLKWLLINCNNPDLYHSYTFRCAGGFVDELRGGSGFEYMAFYPTNAGVVTPRIEKLMLKAGYTYQEY